MNEGKIETIVYGIRHIETKELMPQIKGRKGYSHWNPSNKHNKIENKLTGTPRLFPSEKIAKMVITQWFTNPNASFHSSYNPSTGDENYDINIKPDGRKKEDLEVVTFMLMEIRK